MMQSQHIGLLVLISLTLLGGCEGTRVPLAPSEGAPMNPRLAGWWEAVDVQAGEQNQRMLVLPFNAHEYYLEYVTEGGSSPTDVPERHRFRAYTTPIENVPFANVQCIDCGDRRFLLLRYVLSEDGLLTVSEVAEDVYKTDFQTSEALYAYVRGRLNEDALYGETVSFRRVQTGTSDQPSSGEGIP